MLYLASQFVWFLLAAFGLGFAMGWISHDGGKARFWSGAWSVVAALWIAGAAATWFQLLNGMPATWVETALLFTGVYWVGCVCAGLLRRPAAVQAARSAATPAAVPQPVVEKTPSPVVSPPVPLTGLPPVENEAELPGQRPSGLAAARDDQADDLKLIKGIGRQNEGRLHGLGIWHFEQIADWTAENVEWVGGYLAFPGRIEREDWVGQAKLLAAGAETEFARRAKAGEVETSRDDGSAGQGNVAEIVEDKAGAKPPKS
jgi:predicted flap endonuclease-1-like 5' DNA nuclease